MSVAGAWAFSEHRSKVFEMEQQQAKLAGVEAFKYNNALRRYLAEFSPSSDISTIHWGIKWFQSKEKCGGEIVTGDPKKRLF
ncbi:hypothetical protein I3271_04505 [Photobacterium leiognathi]|uniref:hypothetical protein n=1 Tax=Photobacterium leiognathi TaxID=553611 RepID=UPI001EDD6C2F|nr:hypothetical protein [Photobacterium leiognathi]MCG3883945.1 hypothetical protein [Photobacterium leiognathi]